MINKLALFLFGILAFATIGCKNTIEDKKTAYLDSVILKMETSQAKANALDLEKMMKMDEVYEGYLSFFREQFDSLENGMELLPDIDQLGGCVKKFNKIQGNLPRWQEEMEESLEKLEALRHDYSNKLISEKELDTYLATEMMLMSEVNREFDEHIPGATNCIQNFKSFTDKLDSIRMAHIKAHE